jgi:hypothetical protein
LRRRDTAIVDAPTQCNASLTKVSNMEPSYEIRFNSLYRGHGLCFPCDEKGQVELDALSDRARENYLYARAVVGVEFAYPTVCRAAPSNGH